MSELEKEFIPYEQALALKELGFNEPCLAKYTSDKLLLSIDWNKIWCENISEFEIYTPLYHQAFRWFREKCGLCLVIKPIDDKKLDLGYNLLKNGLIINAHLTYEEAELACIIKLIEKVKNK